MRSGRIWALPVFAGWMLLALTSPFWTGHSSRPPPKPVVAIAYVLPLLALYILVCGAPGALKTWWRWTLGATIFIPGFYGLCYAAVRYFG